MIIEIVVFAGAILDLVLTYNYLRIYRRKFPDKNYIVIEANPLIRWGIRNFGLSNGVAYSGMAILFILGLLLYYLPSNAKWFLAGAYYMMVTFHLTNLLALKRMKVVIEKKDKGGSKNNAKEKETRRWFR